jgi:glutaredoxin 3
MFGGANRRVGQIGCGRIPLPLDRPASARLEYAGLCRQRPARSEKGRVGVNSCDREKEFLSQKGVQFVAKDIRTDKGALDELIQMGFRATPVTLIDGEAVVGFDRAKLEKLLGLS